MKSIIHLTLILFSFTTVLLSMMAFTNSFFVIYYPYMWGYVGIFPEIKFFCNSIYTTIVSYLGYHCQVFSFPLPSLAVTVFVTVKFFPNLFLFIFLKSRGLVRYLQSFGVFFVAVGDTRIPSTLAISRLSSLSSSVLSDEVSFSSFVLCLYSSSSCSILGPW